MSNNVENIESVENVETVETVNIVELENGEKLDFGKNGTVFSSYDVDAGDITFKVATGEVITFNVSDVPENVLKEATIYGLREKIKSTLAPIKLNTTEEETLAGKLNKAEKIVQEITSLKAGEFVTRSAVGGSATLDSFMKAFALVNAIGAIKTDNNGGMVPVPAKGRLFAELKPEWANVNDSAVIASVLSTWDALDRKVKAAQKRNTFLTFQAEYFEAGLVTA